MKNLNKKTRHIYNFIELNAPGDLMRGHELARGESGSQTEISPKGFSLTSANTEVDLKSQS